MLSFTLDRAKLTERLAGEYGSDELDTLRLTDMGDSTARALCNLFDEAVQAGAISGPNTTRALTAKTYPLDDPEDICILVCVQADDQPRAQISSLTVEGKYLGSMDAVGVEQLAALVDAILGRADELIDFALALPHGPITD